MMYKEIEMGGKSLKLRLTAQSCVALEKKLGCNPVSVFIDIGQGAIPTMGRMLAILHASLQEQGYTEADTYALYDAYVDEGHNLFDLVAVLSDVLSMSGFMPTGESLPNETAGK